MVTGTGSIAVIPARGGSKRIPRKNIVGFHGKPLMAWTIEAARNSGVYDKVIVSTEDQEIAEIARAHGAEVPFLRDKEYHDTAPVPNAVISALLQAEDAYQTKFKSVAMLLPTCPVRGAPTIKAAHEFFEKHQALSTISCYQAPGMPWWSHTLSEDFVPTPLFPKALLSGSQDLAKLYQPTGSIWIGQRDHLVKAGNYYAPGHLFCPIDWKAAIDIDTKDDLEYASMIFERFGQV